MIGIGVIGCGYWGPKLVRNFSRASTSQVTTVCDLRYERAARVGAEYRVPRVTDRPEDVLAASDVQLVVVATPSVMRYVPVIDSNSTGDENVDAGRSALRSDEIVPPTRTTPPMRFSASFPTILPPPILKLPEPLSVSSGFGPANASAPVRSSGPVTA